MAADRRASRWRWLAVVLTAALAPVLAAPAAPVGPEGTAPIDAVPTALVRGESAAASTVAPRDAGLSVEHHVTFTVDPAAVAVHVRHDLTLTHQKPDQPVAGGIRYFSFPEYGVPVPAGAVGLAATTDSGSPRASRFEETESPLVVVAIVDLAPDLRYPDTQRLVITYDLPAVPARDVSVVRVNPAFVSFPLLITGDPGLASVEVRVPDPFLVEVVGDDMDQRREGEIAILSATPADPSAWFASIVARDDDRLLSRDVAIGEHGVVVRGWPDDPAWADFAETQVRDGVPVLEELIELPWPATRSLEVLETAAPYLYGFAGWYRPLDSVIEVGDELDQHVMLHELSHLWFNSALFEERWISEALAEVFASAAESALGGTPADPLPVDPGAPGALLLNAWDSPDLEAEISAEQEQYGYNAAWSVLDQITDEVGIEAIAEVVRRADERELPYAGPGLDDGLSRTFGWRELLDLLEESAGSTSAAALFAERVVSPEDQPDLAARAASRARYAEIEARTAPWTPPLVVRLAMADWRFPSADELMAGLDPLLVARDEIEAELSPLEVDLAGLQSDYERARNLDDLADRIESAHEAAGAIAEADRALDGSRNPLQQVGLLFTPPSDRLARAVSDFEDGSWVGAREEADRAVALVEGAAAAGLLRLGAVAALGLVVLLLARARRRPSPPAGYDEPVVR